MRAIATVILSIAVLVMAVNLVGLRGRVKELEIKTNILLHEAHIVVATEGAGR